MYVYEPAILKQGHTGHVILIVAQATVGVVILAAVLQRYFFGRLQPWQAVMLFAAALLLIYPDWRLTLAGLASTVVVLARQATRPAVPVLSAGK